MRYALILNLAIILEYRSAYFTFVRKTKITNLLILLLYEKLK